MLLLNLSLLHSSFSNHGALSDVGSRQISLDYIAARSTFKIKNINL